MAEFQEVMKNKKRMCDVLYCDECPISCDNNTHYLCEDYLCECPQQAEEIIMKWAKEHPVKTNADKFKEVFGFELTKNHIDTYCPFAEIGCARKNPCEECEHYGFWNQEYKPKGSE